MSSPETYDRALANDLRPGFQYQTDNWEEQGSCRSVSPEMFYPGKGGGARRAKAVCAGCVVRQQCLDRVMATELAVSINHRHGVWGGLTPMERYELGVRLKREAEGAPV